ncbi:MAG: hypothetical protein LBV64_03225 [Mediterranea sp.]|nr:hypothetical protein [Mediterranea sp.]
MYLLMGLSYLMSRGMGEPVATASTLVTFPEPGIYYMCMYALSTRTDDWKREIQK